MTKKPFAVNVEYGRSLPLGSHLSIGLGQFDTFEQAQARLTSALETVNLEGYRTVRIMALDTETNSYAKGPYGFNTIYQITDVKEQK